jgi:hypothetical protein
MHGLGFESAKMREPVVPMRRAHGAIDTPRQAYGIYAFHESSNPEVNNKAIVLKLLAAKCPGQSSTAEA